MTADKINSGTPSAQDLARDLAKEERAFIHDLATPLATLNLVLESMIEAGNLPPDSVPERLQQLQRLVGKINTLLRARREILLQRSV
ncbi:MAG: hypothetical protein NDJ89_15855 [Oligoflexia bacterium]|nr:hypothetical protein [Oligoflexia bacterium]